MGPVVTHQTRTVVSEGAQRQAKVATHLRDWRTFLVPEGQLPASLLALNLLLPLETVLTGEVVFTTSSPWQRRSKAGKGVVDGPGDDEVVVDHHEEGDHQHPVAEPRHDGGQPGEELEGRDAGVLAQPQLQEEERQPRHQQHGEVGDEEGDTTVFVTQVGEPSQSAHAQY